MLNMMYFHIFLLIVTQLFELTISSNGIVHYILYGQYKKSFSLKYSNSEDSKIPAILFST